MSASAGLSRRELLKGRSVPPPFLPRPPGVSPASLADCTGCGACLSACPEGVLGVVQGKVALLPQNGECTFCDACALACPEPVFAELRVMGHVFAISADCLAQAGVTCMSCRDACPETAISMRPRIGLPFLPVLAEGLCSGCGACVATCPADAIHVLERSPTDEA